MPYSEKAHRFFEFVAHGGVPRDAENRDLSQAKAKELAAEGVKHQNEVQRRALTRK